jgi:mannose-6-phosphate isomerase-like protein (cupin superfamily)
MEEVEEMTRTWGYWRVLEIGNGYKVKRLEILVDKSISLQYHIHRSETWVITKGSGRVINGGNIFNVKAGDTFVIPKTEIHKITNTGSETLVAIEVQLGETTSEDDIFRV